MRRGRRRASRPGSQRKAGPLRVRPRTTRPPTSRCWRGSSRCAGAPACISAAPTRRRCTTSSPRCIDNSMDEAVAGYADRIEVDVEDDGFLTVTDNGRGIPVDPHPKFKKKSALEIIMTTLHAGGKFTAKVYDTSRRPARRRRLGRERAVRARSKSRSRATASFIARAISRGDADGPLKKLGAVHNRRGTRVRFHADPEIFGKGAAFEPARLFRMARSKAYLFRGVEIRWRCDPSAARRRQRRRRRSATFHFPGGLKDFLAEPHRRPGRPSSPSLLRRRRTEKTRRPRRGRMGDRLGSRLGERRLPPLLLQHHPDARRRHPRGGPARRARQGPARPTPSSRGNKRVAIITADDVMNTAAALALRLHPRAAIRGPDQGPARLAPKPPASSRPAVRDPFDHWLAGHPTQANRLLDWVVEPAEERLRRRKEKEIGRQSADAQTAPAGQARRLLARAGATAPKSSSSKATRPAARPSRRATARRRPSCRCAARS